MFARCDERGELLVEDGRVEVRYKPNDGKAYRASPANLKVDPQGPIFPDSHCGEGAPVESKGATTKARTGSRGGASRDAGMSPVTEAELVAYTDGACSGNPGPAGVGVVLLERGARRELSEYLGIGTNNIAELTAILRVLEALEPTSEPLVVHTDSQYAIGILQKNWKPKANVELIGQLKQCAKAFPKLRLVYVRGHAGIPLNERADELARRAVAERASSGWIVLRGASEAKSDGPHG